MARPHRVRRAGARYQFGTLQALEHAGLDLYPQFDWLGNDYWRPELIRDIWKQSGSGRIPVSGAGYRGPFTGPGFDRVPSREVVGSGISSDSIGQWRSLAVAVRRWRAASGLDCSGAISDAEPFVAGSVAPTVAVTGFTWPCTASPGRFAGGENGPASDHRLHHRV